MDQWSDSVQYKIASLSPVPKPTFVVTLVARIFKGELTGKGCTLFSLGLFLSSAWEAFAGENWWVTKSKVIFDVCPNNFLT